jgi:ubiquinol-cytochrome c reductase cytochrome b subunit/menaquinol-cytochrome c reductase cytochrome b/c subunit
MSSEEQRRQFELYKKNVERRGKPFYPYAMFHDTIMSFVVVCVIVGLACLWYFTSSEEAGDSGVLGPRYTEESDPGTISFTPRPDWYFYFLFYLLRIFKWPESVILATVGIPTILLIILIMVPFFDRRRERRIIRRPVAVVAALLVIASMGVLTYKGATAKEVLASENLALVPEWTARQNLPQDAVPGAEIFAQLTCLNCHSYLGTGGGFAGAPDLTAEGAKGRGVEWQIAHLKCPNCETPGSPMPPFDGLEEEQLRQLAVFLEASKGPGGGG